MQLEDYIENIKKQKNIKTWEEYDLLEKIDENTYKVVSKNNSREWYVDFCQKNNYYFTYSSEASIRFENRQNSNIVLIEYHKQNINSIKFDEKYFQDFFNKVVEEFKITRPIYFDKYLTKQVGSKNFYKQKCIKLADILENEKDILDWFK